MTHNSTTSLKWRIANLLGVLFVGLCLFAITLSVALPFGSHAAARTIVLGPSVDTYVSQASPTKTYATSSQIVAVGGSALRQAFLRFVVDGIPANTIVQSAKLRRPSGVIAAPAVAMTSWSVWSSLLRAERASVIAARSASPLNGSARSASRVRRWACR